MFLSDGKPKAKSLWTGKPGNGRHSQRKAGKSDKAPGEELSPTIRKDRSEQY